eukprot:Gb_15129 [translate_table: standard]
MVAWFLNVELMHDTTTETKTAAAACNGGFTTYRDDSQGNSSSNTYASLLQACGNSEALVAGKQVHAQMVKNVELAFLDSKLMIMYVKCGSLVDAQLVFDRMHTRNVFSWAAMIGGYARHGNWELALLLYYQLLWIGMQPDNFIFPCVLRACAHLLTLHKGKEIHGQIIRSGYESNIFVRNALVDMYAKCGRIDCARQLFDEMAQRDAVSWNTMIVGYVHNGQFNEALVLFSQMQLASTNSNPMTITSVLSACASLAALEQGKEIHGHLIRSGFELQVFVGNALMDMYVKSERVEEARKVFDKMLLSDVISWNTMIAGYVHVDQALKLFLQMHSEGVKPDSVTIATILSTCVSLAALDKVKEIHCYTIQSGIETNVYVGSALVATYARCGDLENARRVFDKMSQRNVVSWNTVIAGCVQNGYGEEAFKLFWQMRVAGLKPDAVTIASILSACADSRDLEQGKRIHGYIIRYEIELDVFMESALVAMYAKCGSIENARKMFDRNPQISLVSWNAMISGSTVNGFGDEALKYFRKMQHVGMKPNSVTMSSVLSACAHLAALELGKDIHDYIIKSGFESDIIIGSALVDMYAKCGSIEDACNVFDRMSQRNLVSWNTMIAAYAMHGHGKEALALFYHMQQVGTRPDHITFTGVLSACSYAGLVAEGWQYFNQLTQDYNITASMEHYACMVDLLGRAGHLEEACDMANKMPFEPDAGVWGALLGACRIHNNVDLGEFVAKRLFNLDPGNAGNYVLLSNIYAGAARWDGVAMVRKIMKDGSIKSRPGCSWIEVKKRVHTFTVGDRSHPQSKKLYAALESLSGQLKEAGYMSDMNFVLHDVMDEEKELILCGHSEKLAIAFGLLNTCLGAPIRVIKNLRICGDCHTVTKFISKIVRRDIIVRDANRFHHFKDGIWCKSTLFQAVLSSIELLGDFWDTQNREFKPEPPRGKRSNCLLWGITFSQDI